MDQILQKIYEIGVIPVIAIDDADKAVPLAQALVKGGLPAAEVTFRTAAGEEAIRRIADYYITSFEEMFETNVPE